MPPQPTSQSAVAAPPPPKRNFIKRCRSSFLRFRLFYGQSPANQVNRPGRSAQVERASHVPRHLAPGSLMQRSAWLERALASMCKPGVDADGLRGQWAVSLRQHRGIFAQQASMPHAPVGSARPQSERNSGSARRVPGNASCSSPTASQHAERGSRDEIPPDDEHSAFFDVHARGVLRASSAASDRTAALPRLARGSARGKPGHARFSDARRAQCVRVPPSQGNRTLRL